MPKMENIYAKLTCKIEGHEYKKIGPTGNDFMYPVECERCGYETWLMERAVQVNCPCRIDKDFEMFKD